MSPLPALRLPQEGSTTAHLANRKRRPISVKQIQHRAEHTLHGIPKPDFRLSPADNPGNRAGVGSKLVLVFPQVSHQIGGDEQRQRLHNEVVEVSFPAREEPNTPQAHGPKYLLGHEENDTDSRSGQRFPQTPAIGSGQQHEDKEHVLKQEPAGRAPREPKDEGGPERIDRVDAQSQRWRGLPAGPQ